METIFPPFDPDDEEGHRPRLRQVRQIPIRMILPNLVTLLALCAGLTAIRMAIEARYGEAIAMIVVAAVLDAIDGRVARLLRSTSRFGAELDSLTDFVNFGVAPAILLYVWALDEVRSLGWIAALVFAICAALRLARFNVSIDNPNKPEWQANFFVGVPAPAGALLVLLPVYLEYLELPHGRFTAPVVAVYTIAIGLLMVSSLPTWSGKKFGARVSREVVLPLFVLVVVLAASLLSYPWHVLTAGAIVYLGVLPVGWRAWRKHEREDRLAASIGADSP
ncbi:MULTISPECIES: CDP-diacylglycerol--serine O-phosphatidyltransferase [Kaistia]|uniref:CDP-diacylglycerol--serine O-phosphatidyltransferase n=1 Tax=Kaistia nematophila TaxID=2994654 RepID=A0A9X3DZG2_9HYPH|nr:CDP-diacylglycerol--serine O-phosphatidyltransferase [Kaistia nematophila]MBN9024454.1 CDP-diacylglycerol--serine O-phosphatidyltransferase [Hyphomicrobiales bacterium]MCX5568680.1 CDP-diacylglycerol--serine O-phosphatidyltransferase [Kaistia nematophila]